MQPTPLKPSSALEITTAVLAVSALQHDADIMHGIVRRNESLLYFMPHARFISHQMIKPLGICKTPPHYSVRMIRMQHCTGCKCMTHATKTAKDCSAARRCHDSEM
jgi:hypothetical protein